MAAGSLRVPRVDKYKLAMCASYHLSKVKDMWEEFKALKAVHALPPSGAAYSSSGATASPTKGSVDDLNSDKGKGSSIKRHRESSSDKEEAYEPGKDDEDESELIKISDATVPLWKWLPRQSRRIPSAKKSWPSLGHLTAFGFAAQNLSLPTLVRKPLETTDVLAGCTNFS